MKSGKLGDAFSAPRVTVAIRVKPEDSSSDGRVPSSYYARGQVGFGLEDGASVQRGKGMLPGIGLSQLVEEIGGPSSSSKMNFPSYLSTSSQKRLILSIV